MNLDRDNIEDIKLFCVRNFPVAWALTFVYSKTVTYTGEFVDAAALRTKNPTKLKNALFDLGLFERLVLEPYEIHPYLRRRIQEFWEKGIRGYGMFSRMTFFTLGLPDVGGKYSVEFFSDVFRRIQLTWRVLAPIIEKRQARAR
ncbi:MAG: hypothetical protein Q6368_002975 [Candidatus Baldrarchaeota archaeon]